MAWGFDTATEIGLLGISAAEAARGMSIWSILVFPALFTAGMSPGRHRADSVLRCSARTAGRSPNRFASSTAYATWTITFASVVVALLVGGIEALGLLTARFGLRGTFWDAITALNGNFGMIGYLIIGVFVLSWGGVQFGAYRLKRYDARWRSRTGRCDDRVLRLCAT